MSDWEFRTKTDKAVPYSVYVVSAKFTAAQTAAIIACGSIRVVDLSLNGNHGVADSEVRLSPSPDPGLTPANTPYADDILTFPRPLVGVYSSVGLSSGGESYVQCFPGTDYNPKSNFTFSLSLEAEVSPGVWRPLDELFRMHGIDPTPTGVGYSNSFIDLSEFAEVYIGDEPEPATCFWTDLLNVTQICE